MAALYYKTSMNVKLEQTTVIKTLFVQTLSAVLPANVMKGSLIHIQIKMEGPAQVLNVLFKVFFFIGHVYFIKETSVIAMLWQNYNNNKQQILIVNNNVTTIIYYYLLFIKVQWAHLAPHIDLYQFGFFHVRYYFVNNSIIIIYYQT